MKTHFTHIGNFTVHGAKGLGESAGIGAAARHRDDPKLFQDTPNPFGIDSEDDLHEAWQSAYENEFEANKRVPRNTCYR